MKKILIIAGEPSADLYGANLVKAIRLQVAKRGAHQPDDIEFTGIGGRLMKQAGVKVIFDADKIAVVGISEVIKHLGMIRQAFKTVEAAAHEEHIDLAILIDFPDFNLRLAKKLHKMNVPLVYYISPQVWAWRKGRIKTIARYFKQVLVIFNFEESIYREAGINVKFVGHPLVKTVRMTKTKEELLKKYGIPADNRIIAMLPGSRTSEVKRLLPIMLEAASIINESYKKLSFIMPILSSQAEVCGRILDTFKVPVKIIIDDTYNAVGMSEFAVVASGTATLETALLDIPMVIVYKVSFLSHMVAKVMLSINRIGIVNIATGEDIVPELVQTNLKPGTLANMIDGYLKDKVAYSRMKEGYLKLRNILSDTDASEKAAYEIIKLLESAV
jgi:lipid-A-disaccharide synthase